MLMRPIDHLLLLLSCLHTATSSAPRYWPKFGGARTVTLLDGSWNYGFLNGGNDPSSLHFDSMAPSFNPSTDPRALTPNKTAVPSSMDVVAGGAPGYLGPRGVGMFRTTFEADTPVRLQFQACSFYCRVWVNGKEIGDHVAGGYVAFWLDVSHEALAASEGQTNELFVLADNRFNSTTAPMHTGGDFWHYGGIMRSVELHTMGDGPVLWRAYVTPSGADASQQTTSEDGTSNVDITLMLSDDTLDNTTVNFSLSFDESAVPVPNTNNVMVLPGGKVLLQNVQVPNASLWSPASPHLHTLTASYAGGVVVERFGLRRFGVSNGRVTINGQVIKLVGWNHHTQFPITAASPTDEQLDVDVALLKRGNANYVRGAHYPHDPRMLDRLDEAGIVFWSETIGPDVKLTNTEDWEYFMPVQLVQLQEMMDNALNHASIFAWGWFNEGPSDQEGACPAYGACADYATSRDPSRFTTWADDKNFNGKCFAHASLISFNNYPGWYNEMGNAKYGKKFWPAQASGVKAGVTSSGPKATRGKPFVISETGAGGIYEWSQNTTDAEWTLKYQEEVILTDVEVAIANDNISGITLWHLFDFKVDNCGAKWPCTKPGGGQENNTHCEYDHLPPTTFQELSNVGPPNCTYIEIDSRPGGENHKGSVDFWRREKPVFAEVSKLYGGAN